MRGGDKRQRTYREGGDKRQRTDREGGDKRQRTDNYSVGYDRDEL